MNLVLEKESEDESGTEDKKGKLDTLNKTLLGMQAKQDKQDEILKALTNTPIYNYGI